MQNQHSNQYNGKTLWRKRTASLFAAAVIGATLGISAGCGGGGGGSAPSAETSRASLTIQWPARSRAASAPSSALSAVVRIVGASVSTGDVAFTINRDNTRTDGYAGQYSAPTETRTGQFTVTITFYAQAEGQGGVVGIVSKLVTLTSGANSLGDVTVDGTVASTSVAARQTISAGETSDLVFTAFDTGNSAIAGVTPGSAFFTVTNGQEFLSVVSGQLKAGTTPGVAAVTVTVDGKTSGAQKVGIGSATSSLTVSGARGTVPLTGAVTDFVGGTTSASGAIQSDQSLPITSNWFYANSIGAPPGYGDRKFDHWTAGSMSVASDPGYNYVPADAAGSLSFTAVYTTRAHPAGGFTPNFSHTQFLHWPQFPLRVYFANGELTTRMKAGLDKWVSATGGVVAYETVADPMLADITFTLGIPPSGLKGTTTVDFDPDTRAILHADIVLLQSAPSEVYTKGGDLLALYAAHEFGHALGMTASAEAGSGHSTNPRDTMFPTANPSAPFITEQDINTLENMYPALFNGGTVSGTRAVQETRKSGKTAQIIVRCP